ncbi:hypothetical protein FRC11_003199, partial [Ceratobasidium sp. 423]
MASCPGPPPPLARTSPLAPLSVNQTCLVQSESNGLSKVELELTCDPNPNPKDNTKTEEPASRNEQLLEDQTCVEHGSESALIPKLERQDNMPTVKEEAIGDEYPHTLAQTTHESFHVQEPLGPIELSTLNSGNMLDTQFELITGDWSREGRA